MAKEKRNLYEEVEFGNDYGYAMQVKREAETQLYEIQKIWGLAIAGTVCGGIGMMLAFHPIFIMIGFVMGCVCYSKVGGFGIAAKWAWNIAKFGWFVVPYFPIDLLVGAIALCLGFLSLFFLPFSWLIISENRHSRTSSWQRHSCIHANRMMVQLHSCSSKYI